MHLPRWVSPAFFVLMVCVLLAPQTAQASEAEHDKFATSILNRTKNPINIKVHQLILQKKFKELDQLFADGADPNTKDNKWVSPIHYAASLGSLEAMQILAKRGANLLASPFGGWSPLHYAASGGHVEVAQFLIANGVPPDNRDIGGETPLFYAVEAKNLTMIKWLVEYGADPNQANNQHVTPLSLAKELRLKEIETYLQQQLDKHNKNLAPQGGEHKQGGGHTH